MRPWMEKWGSVLLIFFCALVILFAALYTRQDDIRRIAAQNAAATQDESLPALPAYCPPVSSAVTKLYAGPCQTENGVWQMDPCVYYAVSQNQSVSACCAGVILHADEQKIVIQSSDHQLFSLHGVFSLLTRAGDTVTAGAPLATIAERGEMRLSLSVDGHYLDPLSCF